MIKRYLLLVLLLPALVFCNRPDPVETPKEEETQQPQVEPYQEPVFERNSDDPLDEVLEGIPPQITDGAMVQVTRQYVEKFLSEVHYADHDYSTTSILEYEGGFNNQDATDYPVYNADKPALYSIRWTPDPAAGDLILSLKDGDWRQEIEIPAGADHQIITNLRPNATYTYSVYGKSSDWLATSGSFTTIGSIHQVFFDWNVRNARDLGGWETYDGKKVKYRKIYRGGRMEGSTMSPEGRKAILAEGIKAQLELRGKSDMLKWCALGEEYAFCNPCIENGGTSMLGTYKAKTKQCFEFVVNCVREDKPVYFHCSLGRDRTGTLAALLLGVLGVKEGDISKEYEVSYFAPRGWSIAYSETSKVFRNTRQSEYKSIAGYFWQKGYDKTTNSYERFDKCVEKYLLEIGVSQKDIDDFRSLMLEE